MLLSKQKGKLKMKMEMLANKINSIVNTQVVKFYVKKSGHWDEATRKDLLFFSKKDFKDVWPKKRGDILQTNTWKGNILAIFIANANNKDIRYTIGQLERAEKLAPNWVRENSMA